MLIGLLFMLGSAGAGGYVAWQNRRAMVHAHVGGVEWTGHLWAVLVIGALLACWFVLGAAFIQCRIAERRGARRAAETAAATGASDDPVPARRSRTTHRRANRRLLLSR